MATGFSNVVLVGNLTRDPEVRSTGSGANVTAFTVAVNKIYKDRNGQNVEQVSFFDCSAWGRVGEIVAQYAKKGSGVIVSGSLEQRRWEDKATGQKRSAVEIRVNDFKFLPKAANLSGDAVPTDTSYAGYASSAPAGATASSASATAGAPAGMPAEVVPEDIPDAVDLGDIPF